MNFCQFLGRPPRVLPFPPSRGRTRCRLFVLPIGNGLDVFSSSFLVNVFSMFGCHCPTWDGATICSCSWSILLGTYDKCDLHLQEHPMHVKLPHLDCFQSFVHGKHDLVRIGRGFLGCPYICISFSSDWPDNILYFLGVSNLCGHEIFPSWWRTLELKESPMYIQWNLDWPLFLVRDAGMCNRRCLHSNMIGMLCTASLGPSRTIQTTQRCQRPESSSSTLDWTGCKLDFSRGSYWRACRSGWFSIFLTNPRTWELSACFTTECSEPWNSEVHVRVVQRCFCSWLTSSWLTKGCFDLSRSVSSPTLNLML